MDQVLEIPQTNTPSYFISTLLGLAIWKSFILLPLIALDMENLLAAWLLLKHSLCKYLDKFWLS